MNIDDQFKVVSIYTAQQIAVRLFGSNSYEDSNMRAVSVLFNTCLGRPSQQDMSWIDSHQQEFASMLQSLPSMEDVCEMLSWLVDVLDSESRSVNKPAGWHSMTASRLGIYIGPNDRGFNPDAIL